MQPWLDRLVPAARCTDPEALRRARLTVVLSTVLIVAAIVYSTFYGLVVGFRAGSVITAVGGAVAVAALAVLRSRPTLRALGHVITGLLYSVVAAIVAQSGGLPSPVAPWLVMPPMFAALLLGRRGAAWWTVLCVLTIAGYFVAGRYGARFPVGYAADWTSFVTVMSYAGLVVCSAVLLFVFEDIRAAAQARAEAARAALARLAYHDALTGLANRARFLECLDAAVERARAADGPGRVAVLLLDLDGFKTVNDSLGHAAGDALLVEVAARLLNATRGCDTVARLGGDEFAVLLDNVRHDADTAAVADRIVNAMAAPFELRGHAAAVGTSLGVARASAGAAAPDAAAVAAALLHDADVAMYRAKALGKGRWVHYEPGMHSTSAPPAAPEWRRATARGRLGLA